MHSQGHPEGESVSCDLHVMSCDLQQAMKDEHHEMKKLVLAYEQRQEEEDYSGTTQIQ